MESGKLSQPNRAGLTEAIAIAASATLLLATFFFPLWQIQLWAPQYPEGLFMSIWTSKLSGDVNNINVLNHYIGMHKILAKDFPELKVLPKGVLVV